MNELIEALRAIINIPNRLDGGDWDEIEEAREIARLTGYVRASAQLEWCKANGVQAYLSARGEVVIPLSAIEGRKAANDTPWTPDFTAISGRG